METSVGIEGMRENVLSSALSPEEIDHPLCPWESTCEGVSELDVLQFVICIFAKPESWVHNTAGRWKLKEGYCHKISQRHEGSLILSKVPGLEILRYRLAKKFIHVCCSIFWKTSKELLGQFFSDPVFWTKPQGIHSFHPWRNQKRFWVATSSLLLPGALLWSLSSPGTKELYKQRGLLVEREWSRVLSSTTLGWKIFAPCVCISQIQNLEIYPCL